VTIRVLLADDHPLVRDGLKAALATLPDVEVVAEAATGSAAIREALLHRPDVVVMDLQMPRATASRPPANWPEPCHRRRCWC
jgi:DNA-binding NarL/FixJ family response regulator